MLDAECQSASSTSVASTAHRAQILGHDEIGIELAQRALIKVVQILTRRDAPTVIVIDLRRVSPTGNVVFETTRRVRGSAG